MYVNNPNSSDPLRQLEEQLIQSEKLSTLGKLVAGVAHEINNPVCYVKTNLHTLRQYVEHMDQMLEQTLGLADGATGTDLKESTAQIRQRFDYDFVHAELPLLLDETIEGIERIERIVAGIRDYAHVDGDEGQLINLNELIARALRLVHHEVKSVVQQVNEDYAELPAIWCCPSQISQVLVNLLVNAAHAMPSGGDIDICTRLLNEGWIELRVCDRGEGISVELLPRLFDAFVTTKPAGKGTGLGLSVSHQIVANHGGTIRAENRQGGGACFSICLPITPAACTDPQSDSA